MSKEFSDVAGAVMQLFKVLRAVSEEREPLVSIQVTQKTMLALAKSSSDGAASVDLDLLASGADTRIMGVMFKVGNNATD